MLPTNSYPENYWPIFYWPLFPPSILQVLRFNTSTSEVHTGDCATREPMLAFNETKEVFDMTVETRGT